MTVSLSPILNGWQGFTTTGLPLNAGLIYQYAAGTTTPQATYTTNTGLVQNANPIILGADGRPPQEIWLTDGLSYKFVVQDSLANTIATYDNIQSVGTLIQNFINSTSFLTASDGRYPIYVGTAGGSANALTAVVATNITSLYNGMIVSVDAIAQNTSTTPTFTLTLGTTVTATMAIVDYNIQPVQPGAIAGNGHKLLLAYNAAQARWILINPQPVLPNNSIVTKRQSVLIGPKDINGFPSLLPQTATGLNITTQNIVPLEAVQSSTVSTPVASPGVVTWTGHTLVANQAVSFNTTGALPTGLVVGTAYYVLNPVANQFNVSATPGGAAINFTGATSGQSYCFAGVQNLLVAASAFGNDGANGELNQIGFATANFTWTGLANNTTNYLYVLISPLGIFTAASTTLAPVITYGANPNPDVTLGQITIDVVLNEVYLGNGTTAPETNLVVIGSATTSGGNVTGTVVYQYGKPPTFTNKKSGTLLKRTVYSTAGTFTWIKSAQTTGINVKVRGGGGAGGNANSNAQAFAQGGSGGGEGGWAEGFFDATLFISQTVTLALSGTSSFGALISATSGTNGANGGGGGAALPGLICGAGGTGTGGDIQINGMQGDSTVSGATALTTGSLPAGGKGGGAAGGYGAPGQIGANAVNGGNGLFGSGGGGAAPGTGNSNGSGGTGSVGYIIVEEFA